MSGHRWRTRVSTPKDAPKDWRSPIEEEMSQRERDRLFLRRLAQAFEAGHHLPAGQVPMLRLRG